MRGVEAIGRIFEHMLRQVDAPRFVVTERMAGADGRVHHHRDYWNAAEELYMKLPLIGGLMRGLRRALAA